MVKFKFRLEKVLEYRETVEKLKKTEYGKAKRRYDDELYKLDQYMEERKKSINERNAQVNNTNINELRTYNQYLDSVKSRIRNQKQVVDKTQEIAENARTELIESTKDKKIIQKLKVRDINSFRYLEKKDEEKITDQFVSYKSSVK